MKTSLVCVILFFGAVSAFKDIAFKGIDDCPSDMTVTLNCTSLKNQETCNNAGMLANEWDLGKGIFIKSFLGCEWNTSCQHMTVGEWSSVCFRKNSTSAPSDKLPAKCHASTDDNMNNLPVVYKPFHEYHVSTGAFISVDFNTHFCDADEDTLSFEVLGDSVPGMNHDDGHNLVGILTKAGEYHMKVVAWDTFDHSQPHGDIVSISMFVTPPTPESPSVRPEAARVMETKPIGLTVGQDIFARTFM